jgi:tetratricopeptide (TPR) repeat protein
MDRRFYLAKALIKEDDRDEGEKELRRLLELAPSNANTKLVLGRLLASLGRLDEARAVLSGAIEGAPWSFQTLAEIKRFGEQDRPLLDRMETALKQPDLAASPRAAIHFGLGKAYEDLGNYAKAIGHYDAGNRLRKLSARFDRGALQLHVDGVIRAFSAEALKRSAQSLSRPPDPSDDLPVLIVGMPRSGTTLVEQILSSHPAVAAGGEISFWKERLAGWQTANRAVKEDKMWEAGKDYLALLRKIGPGALRVTDKAPRNFELLWLPWLVLPRARIIHCRRHPVDTCLSNYFTNFLASQEFSWDRGDLAFYYRQYERLMDHWRKVLPAERITEVDYETLVADPEAETRRLVSFLGLAWDDACLTPEKNRRLVQTANVWEVRQPVYRTSVERWRRYEPYLGELRQLLPAAGPFNPSAEARAAHP